MQPVHALHNITVTSVECGQLTIAATLADVLHFVTSARLWSIHFNLHLSKFYRRCAPKRRTMASIVRSDLASVAGCSLAQTYSIASSEGPGKIYSVADKRFDVLFTESGVAYGESSKTDVTVKHNFCVSEDGRRLGGVQLVEEPVEMWGINFPGTLQVGIETGSAATIYLPGVRMYDPTGRTGDAHASERVGPSCAAFQTTVSVIELAAAYHGATLEQLREVHEAFRPCVVRYHGRLGLFDWMFQQLEDVVYNKKEATPFSTFTQSMVDAGKLNASAAESEHTMIYLKKHVAPPAYFRKVKAKDDVDSVVLPENRAKFDSFL